MQWWDENIKTWVCSSEQQRPLTLPTSIEHNIASHRCFTSYIQDTPSAPNTAPYFCLWYNTILFVYTISTSSTAQHHFHIELVSGKAVSFVSNHYLHTSTTTATYPTRRSSSLPTNNNHTSISISVSYLSHIIIIIIDRSDITRLKQTNNHRL